MKHKGLNLGKNNHILLLLTVIIISAILRFYRIHDLLFFGMDQEYEAFIIKNILSLRHFPLIGVNASDTGLYLGPAFIYIAAVPYFIFQGNPLGGAVFASSLGIITTLMIYLIGKEWFSKEVGLLASFFWAFSFIGILYDRQFWNPTPLSFLSLVILFSLTKIIKGQSNYFIALGLTLGLSLQSHLQAVIFLPIVTFFLIKYQNLYIKRYLLVFLFIIFIFQLPLILFDLRHNLTNAKALIELISSSQDIIKTDVTPLVYKLSLFANMLGRSIYIRNPTDLYVENGQCAELIPYIGKTNILAIIAIICLLVYFLYQSLIKKNKEIKDLRLITSIVILTLLGIFLYNRPIYEYYFLYLLPILYLTLAWVSIHLFYKKFRYILLFLIVFYASSNIKTFIAARSNFAHKDKISSINYAKKYVDENNFSLEVLGECSKFGGYRYLMEFFGKRPGSSYMDPYFSWLYGEPIKEKYPRTIVFSVIDERERKSYQKWKKIEKDYINRMTTNAQFGNIRVIVANNENN